MRARPSMMLIKFTSSRCKLEATIILFHRCWSIILLIFFIYAARLKAGWVRLCFFFLLLKARTAGGAVSI